MLTASPHTYTKLLPISFAMLAVTGFSLVLTVAAWVLPMTYILLAAFVLFAGILFFAMPDPRRSLLFLLVFVIPLNIDVNFIEQASPGGADGLSLGLVELFLAMLLIITLLRSMQAKHAGTFRFFPAILLPSLAIFVFYLISMFQARDLMWSLFDTFNFIKVILFFLIVANNLKSEKDVHFVLCALFFGMIVQAGMATAMNVNPATSELLQKVKIGVALETGAADFARSGGSLGNSNHLGRYLGLILPISFILMLTQQSRVLKRIAAMAALFGLYAIINTFSRSAWAGLLLSAFMLPLMLHRRLISFRTLLWIGLAALVGASFLFLYGDMIWARLTLDDNGSAMTRITTAKVAWAIIKDYPFFGCGINNYGGMLAEYWIGEDTFTNKAAVHNNYLLYMAEIGIIGFSAFVWLLVAFAVRIGRAVKSASRLFTAVAIGVLGGYAGMLMESLTDKSYKENFSLLLLFWGLMALIEGIIRIDSEKQITGQSYVNR